MLVQVCGFDGSLRLPVMLKFADNMNAIVVYESSISVVIRDQSVSLTRVDRKIRLKH